MRIKYTLISVLLLFLFVKIEPRNVPLPDLVNPDSIVIQNNLAIITEFPNVYIYGVEDFQLVKKFGIKGEGPREFSRYVRIQPHPDHPDKILVGSHMKLSYYTLKGEFIREIKNKGNSTANVYKPLGGGKFVAYGFNRTPETIFTTVDLFDESLTKVKTVTRWEYEIQDGKKINSVVRDNAGGEFKIYEGKIFTLARNTGDVAVFDGDGNKVNTIRFKYESVKVTDEDKKETIRYFTTSPVWKQFYAQNQNRFEFPKYFPPVRVLSVSNDRIYVLTSKKEKERSEFVIFDLKGNFIKKILVPFKNMDPRNPNPFFINDHKFYQLIEDADGEEWLINIFELK